jgi:hypothetical protein
MIAAQNLAARMISRSGRLLAPSVHPASSQRGSQVAHYRVRADEPADDAGDSGQVHAPCSH